MKGAFRRAGALLVPYAACQVLVVGCLSTHAQVGEDTLRIGGHRNDVLAVAFSPDSKRVLAHSDSGVIIYDAVTGKLLADMEKPTSAQGVSVFSPDGKSVAAICSSELHVYDSHTGKRRFRTKQLDLGEKVLAWSPDGQWIAADKALLKASSGQVAATYCDERRGKLTTHTRVEFSPDSRKVYGIIDHEQVVVGSLPDGLAEAPTPQDLVFGARQPVGDGTDFAISPDGRSMAIRHGDRVVIQALAGGTATPVTLDYLAKDISRCYMAFNPKRENLAVAGYGSQSLGFYDIRSGMKTDSVDVAIQPEGRSPWWMFAIALSPDGSRMAVGYRESALVFNIATAVKATIAGQKAAAQKEADEVARIAAKKAAEAKKEAAEARSERDFAENAKPNWEGFEDLNALIKGCGLIDTAPVEWEVSNFVRYGTAANAAKALKGDRFDKEDAADAAKGHLAGLAKRKFYLRLNSYSWLEDESDTKSVLLQTSSPGCRAWTKLALTAPCDVPAVFNPAFLTKDGALKPAPGFSIERLRAEGAEVYVPESATSSYIRIQVPGEREELKAIAHEPDRHVVTIGLADLRLDAPFQYGWFRYEELIERRFNTQRIRGSYDVGLDGGDRPNYFVTKVRKEVDDPNFPPIPIAEIVRIQIVRKEPDGRATVVFEEGK